MDEKKVPLQSPCKVSPCCFTNNSPPRPSILRKFSVVESKPEHNIVDSLFEAKGRIPEQIQCQRSNIIPSTASPSNTVEMEAAIASHRNERVSRHNASGQSLSPHRKEVRSHCNQSTTNSSTMPALLTPHSPKFGESNEATESPSHGPNTSHSRGTQPAAPTERGLTQSDARNMSLESCSHPLDLLNVKVSTIDVSASLPSNESCLVVTMDEKKAALTSRSKAARRRRSTLNTVSSPVAPVAASSPRRNRITTESLREAKATIARRSNVIIENERSPTTALTRGNRANRLISPRARLESPQRKAKSLGEGSNNHYLPQTGQLFSGAVESSDQSKPSAQRSPQARAPATSHRLRRSFGSRPDGVKLASPSLELLNAKASSAAGESVLNSLAGPGLEVPRPGIVCRGDACASFSKTSLTAPTDDMCDNCSLTNIMEPESDLDVADLGGNGAVLRVSAPGAFAVGDSSESSFGVNFDCSNDIGTHGSFRKSLDTKDVSDCVFVLEQEQSVSNLVKAVAIDEDNFVPAAIEFDSDQKCTHHQKAERCPLVYVAVFVSFLVVSIASSLLLVRGRQPKESQRMIDISNAILAMDSAEVFDPESHYFQMALQWIADVDRLVISIGKSEEMLQRFVVVYFYFATTAKGNWERCGPPTDSTEHEFCDDDLVGRGKRWLTSAPECKWAGIRCTVEGKVQTIYCGGFGLTGHVPGVLLVLPKLRQLVLPHNRLSGIATALPSDLSTVVLRNNSFTGAVDFHFQDLASLKVLDLSDNQLYGPISDMSALQSLSVLSLSGNQISGPLPSSLFKLSGLEELRLNRNAFYGSVPVNIQQLSLLHFIDVSSNSLTGFLPDEIFDIRTLKTLLLSNNRFTGNLSPKVGQLTALAHLDLSDNQLTGTIPTSSNGDYPALIEASFSSNSLSGSVPPGFCSRMAGSSLEADCLPDRNGEAEIQCECCSVCCDTDGKQCVENP